MDRTTKTMLALNLYFEHNGLNLHENEAHLPKERNVLVFGPETTFTLYLYLRMTSAFAWHGNT